jgi:dTDP-4-amino-4,6-dideoxy-D-galactose acyltransferase
MIDVLEWDSEFFGRRIARYRRPRFLPGDSPALVDACAAQRVDCAYILVDAADTESIRELQHAGAYFADVRVTFGAQLGDCAPRQTSVATRTAVESDLPSLMQIAAVSHRDTRFFADDHFDPARCVRLYETWIENSCRGFADVVFVADDGHGRPSGYVTCHRDASTNAHIGLFAVGEAHQGRGCGTALIAAARSWFRGAGVTDMTVATQLRNLRAAQFYTRVGLDLRHVGVWFHLWPNDRIRGGA